MPQSIKRHVKTTTRGQSNPEPPKRAIVGHIDQAKFLEFLLLENFGENLETISTLDQLTEVSGQARDRLSQLSTIHLRIAEVQPTTPADLLRLMNGAISSIQSRIPALERSLEEIKLDWRLT